MTSRVNVQTKRVRYSMASADPGVLYVVATPIGNLGDLTRRAETVLKTVQILAAEDTRRTRVLLDHLDHRVPELKSLHGHNEHAVSEELLARLLAGADVALVSDAGTPLINDPGFPLVGAAHAAGVKVVPVPGASAVTAALSVCPLPCQPFRFIGFLPPKAKQRGDALDAALASPDAVVFLEAPHRILATLADLGDRTARRVMVARELTKRYESLYVGSAEAIKAELGESPRGEIVVVVETAADSAPAVELDAARVMDALLTELPPAKAAKIAAQILGAKRSDMYALAELRKTP